MKRQPVAIRLPAWSWNSTARHYERATLWWCGGGRSLPDLVQTVADLEQRGIDFESLTEKIETGSAAGRLVFHVFAALSEFERDLIRERKQAGLVAARARGRAGGRKPKLDDKQVREIKVLLRNPNFKVTDVARRYGVSRTTLYKHVAVIVPK